MSTLQSLIKLLRELLFITVSKTESHLNKCETVCKKFHITSTKSCLSRAQIQFNTLFSSQYNEVLFQERNCTIESPFNSTETHLFEADFHYGKKKLHFISVKLHLNSVDRFREKEVLFQGNCPASVNTIQFETSRSQFRICSISYQQILTSS